jgi:hypothetical protein
MDCTSVYFSARRYARYSSIIRFHALFTCVYAISVDLYHSRLWSCVYVMLCCFHVAFRQVGLEEFFPVSSGLTTYACGFVSFLLFVTSFSIRACLVSVSHPFSCCGPLFFSVTLSFSRVSSHFFLCSSKCVILRSFCIIRLLFVSVDI